MNNGKYARQPRRRRRSNRKKASFLLTSLILLLTLFIGGTTAFLIAKGNPVTNTFKPSRVASSVIEDAFNGTTKTNVKIRNSGDTTSYIRAAIVVTWQDASGNVYPGTPVSGTHYNMSLNLSETGETGWIKIGDFYYYTQPVEPGQETAVLINSCTPVEGQTPAGYGLNVEILGSAIQSVPISVVTSNWGVTVDNQTGNITG